MLVCYDAGVTLLPPLSEKNVSSWCCRTGRLGPYNALADFGLLVTGLILPAPPSNLRSGGLLAANFFFLGALRHKFPGQLQLNPSTYSKQHIQLPLPLACSSGPRRGRSSEPPYLVRVVDVPICSCSCRDPAAPTVTLQSGLKLERLTPAHTVQNWFSRLAAT